MTTDQIAATPGAPPGREADDNHTADHKLAMPPPG